MSVWKKVSEERPPEETPVLLLVNGTIYEGVLAWEHPTYEETFTAFQYFVDTDERCDWEWDEVTHWMPLPAAPDDAQLAAPAAWTDEQIVALLASLGIDADKSKYGFPELQVHTTVPGVRQILERAQVAAQPAPGERQP